MTPAIIVKEVSMVDSNAGRKLYNSETLTTATMHKALWDGGDVDYLEKHLQDPTVDTAIELGRTFQAVQDKRYDLKLRKENNMGKKKIDTPKVEPMTLIEACTERDKLKEQGMAYPTIMSIPGGYKVIEGRAANQPTS